MTARLVGSHETIPWPLWGSYVCDSRLPGKGCPCPISDRLHLLSVGLGYSHMTNIAIAGSLPGRTEYEASGMGLRLSFSDEWLYPLAKQQLTLELEVNGITIEILGLSGLHDHSEEFDPFPEEGENSGSSRMYRLDPRVYIQGRQQFNLILRLEHELLTELQSAEWALRFRPREDLPHDLDWRRYRNWYAEIRGFLVGDYHRSYI